MSEYVRPSTAPSTKIGPLEHAAKVAGVVWPKDLKAALKDVATAKERASQAQKIAALGRQDLLAEWELRRQAHSDAEAAAKDPEDFKPFAEPRPDVDYLQELNSVYSRGLTLAQNRVDREAGNYSVMLPALRKAWAKLPVVDENSMTVAEAKALEASNSEATSALLDANSYLAKLAGADEREYRALRKRQRDEGRLVSLDEVTASMQGKSEAQVAKARRARELEAEARRAEKVANKAYAQAAAKARVGGSK